MARTTLWLDDYRYIYTGKHAGQTWLDDWCFIYTIKHAYKHRWTINVIFAWSNMLTNTVGLMLQLYVQTCLTNMIDVQASLANICEHIFWFSLETIINHALEPPNYQTWSHRRTNMFDKSCLRALFVIYVWSYVGQCMAFY